MTPHWIRRLATLCHERATAYRQVYIDTDTDHAFPTSPSYPIYATLTELHLLLNKLADEIDDE